MDITYSIVRDKFNYNDEIGWLIWKNCKQKKLNGMRAGSLNKSSGYRTIRINNKNYGEHRIIWLWCKGYLSENQIDHINRIKDDNRICNLREATPSCNNKNKGLQCNNKTGIIGIRFRNGKYETYIQNNKGKTIDSGTFNTLLDGAKARYLGEVKYNYENCNSTSTAYQYIKDNDTEWLNGDMQVEKNKSKPNKSSGIEGVWFNKLRNKWMVGITINKKRKHLGYFIELDDAVMTRYEAEVKYNQTKNSQAYDYLIKK